MGATPPRRPAPGPEWQPFVTLAADRPPGRERWVPEIFWQPDTLAEHIAAALREVVPPRFSVVALADSDGVAITEDGEVPEPSTSRPECRFLAEPEQPEATKYIAARVQRLCTFVTQVLSTALAQPWPHNPAVADRDSDGRPLVPTAWTSWMDRTIWWGWIYPASEALSYDDDPRDVPVLLMPRLVVAGDYAPLPWEVGSDADPG